jgi:hypothetical protein
MLVKHKQTQGSHRHRKNNKNKTKKVYSTMFGAFLTNFLVVGAKLKATTQPHICYQLHVV